MQGNYFMQLLIILALLLYGGKSGAQNILSEVKPVLESIGGDQMREALKSAEEISSVLSAVKEMTGTGGINAVASAFSGTNTDTSANASFENKPAIAFPLAPINDIADKDITYSLSKYFANEN